MKFPKINWNFDKIKKKYSKFKKNFRNKKEILKKSVDDDDKKVLKAFILGVACYGLMSNFSAFVLFGLPFTWYSWIGYGFAIIIIENKILRWLRKLWFK